MRCLTLHRPWPAFIFGLGGDSWKQIENRSWKPPDSVVGTRIAIHAGRAFDDSAVERVKPWLWEWEDTQGLRDEGVVGTVLLRGWVFGGGMVPFEEHSHRMRLGVIEKSPALTRTEAEYVVRNRWFAGTVQRSSVGWVLAERVRFAEPVPCRGRQGLWTLPSDVERAVVEAERAARLATAVRQEHAP